MEAKQEQVKIESGEKHTADLRSGRPFRGDPLPEGQGVYPPPREGAPEPWLGDPCCDDCRARLADP